MRGKSLKFTIQTMVHGLGNHKYLVMIAMVVLIPHLTYFSVCINSTFFKKMIYQVALDACLEKSKYMEQWKKKMSTFCTIGSISHDDFWGRLRGTSLSEMSTVRCKLFLACWGCFPFAGFAFAEVMCCLDGIVLKGRVPASYKWNPISISQNGKVGL